MIGTVVVLGVLAAVLAGLVIARWYEQRKLKEDVRNFTKGKGYW